MKVLEASRKKKLFHMKTQKKHFKSLQKYVDDNDNVDSMN